MQPTETYSSVSALRTDAIEKGESNSSCVSWAAVIAGAFVTAALSLIMLALGTGIGLSSISPWANQGVSASTTSFLAIAWIILTQIIAAAMGGYLAGRLRTKWVNVHSDEVHFRDTAHGFLVWAVGLVITFGFLASAATSMVGGASRIGSALFSSAQADDQRIGPSQYFVDTLFRSYHRSSDHSFDSDRSEISAILANAVRQGKITDSDKQYLGAVVSSKTGLSQAEAEQRVSNVVIQIQQAADGARKAVAHSLYWTFLALLTGAFCASFSATIGGKQRDRAMTSYR